MDIVVVVVVVIIFVMLLHTQSFLFYMSTQFLCDLWHLINIYYTSRPLKTLRARNNSHTEVHALGSFSDISILCYTQMSLLLTPRRLGRLGAMPFTGQWRYPSLVRILRHSLICSPQGLAQGIPDQIVGSDGSTVMCEWMAVSVLVHHSYILH